MRAVICCSVSFLKNWHPVSWCCYSGLAKPGPVIETFYTDELLSRYVKLDGVVTLVDSVNALKHLDEVKPRFVVNEAVEQIAYADRIIINKVCICFHLFEVSILLSSLAGSMFFEGFRKFCDLVLIYLSNSIILTDRFSEWSWSGCTDKKN